MLKNFKIKNNLYPNEEIDEEFINLFNSIKNESSKQTGSNNNQDGE